MSSPQQDTELDDLFSKYEIAIGHIQRELEDNVIGHRNFTAKYDNITNKLKQLLKQREERLVREAELAIADRIEALPSSRRGNVSVHDVSDISTSLRLKHKMRDIALRKEQQGE